MTDKFQHINVPLITDEYSATVCWGELDNEAWIYLKSVTDNAATACDVDGRGAIWAHEGWKYQPVIYVALPVQSIQFFATLSHEATHCINVLWEKLGEEYKGEIFAYCVGAIVGAVERQVKK